MNTIDRIYTTEELVQILETERLACMNGERTFPMPDNAEEIAKQTPVDKKEPSPLGEAGRNH